MNSEIILPIKWQRWDEQSTLILTFYQVEFTADFGEIKKDNKFSSITVDYGDGIIDCYNEEGSEVIITQKFIATPL